MFSRVLQQDSALVVIITNIRHSGTDAAQADRGRASQT
jgi:hypothetical protein